MASRVAAAQERIQSIANTINTARVELLQVKKSLPALRREISVEDLDDDPSASTEMRTVIDCVICDSLDPAIRDLLDVAAYRPGSTSAPIAAGHGLDSDETRQRLYDLVVRDNFTPQASEDPEDEWVPASTPEEAGLRVFFEHGRWFATWLKQEEPEDAPEAQRRELLVLLEDPEEPGRLVYRAV